MKNSTFSNIELEIPIYKEYNIKNNNDIFNLRIEILNRKIITFSSFNLNTKIDFIYKNKFSLESFSENLTLNTINIDSILLLFDNIHQNHKIYIYPIDINRLNLLIIKNSQKFEIILNKTNMTIDDKFNILNSQINLIKNEKINLINNEINKKEDDLKNIINEKDIIIKEMNDKILIQEILIKEHTKEIDSLNNKINEIKNNLEQKIKEEIDITNKKPDKIHENENQIKKELNNNILREKDNLIYIINDNVNEIKRLNDEIKYNFNKKMDNDLTEEELNELLKLNKIKKYFIFTEHEYKEEPQKLKYKLDITNTNDNFGVNDIFEIYVSYKDFTTYIVSPNINNYNLDLYNFPKIKLTRTLNCHKNRISTTKYYIEKYYNNEYLISADINQLVIIWDISNDYNIKHIIDTKYSNFSIFSCVILFNNNYSENIINDNMNNYIITSTRNESKEIEKASTKIYSLNTGKFIKYIKNSNNYNIYYLLTWYNRKNKKFYIIQFADKKIIINNLLEDELYSELINVPEDSHYSGFIYVKDENEYLFSSSYKGKIDIWDLNTKKIYQVIKMNKCNLFHIIQWNKKYIICADYKNKSFQIIDLTKNKIVGEIKGEHKKSVKSIKKLFHPKYGECLLSSGNDNVIKLWSI